MNTLTKIWNKLSTLGLKGDEVHSLREIHLLNKINVLAILLVVGFIPYEIFLNGFQLVPVELASATIFSIGLFFTSKRWFTLAKYYGIIVSIILIFIMTYIVGGYSNSEYILFAILLLPVILFKKRMHIMAVSLVVVVAFFILKYTYPHVTPLVDIPMDLKLKVQPIINMMTMTLLFLGVYYFKLINESYENQLNHQKLELADANEELAQINEELAIQRDEIERQKNVIEEAHIEITDSIAYAKRIQNAILPSQTLINELLPNNFILYKPKDVVAGDFYWLEKINDFILFAVADCTGHGVPGAMVSVVCNNALNRSVREFKLSDPSKILDKTREIVLEELSKSGDVKDGMDISLACFDFEKMKLEWAGANNPLYLLRHSKEGSGEESKEIESSSFRTDAGGVESEFSIEITKGDREPIGYTENPTPFITHTIELQKGDIIYLFTDGYADQFGGNQGKKLGYKKFREKLIEISSLEMNEQKIQLENYFTDWKGVEEQVDDVCVIVIKI